MTDQHPPQTPPVQGRREPRRRKTDGRHPEGVAAERPGSARRCMAGHPYGVPSILDPADGRFDAHIIHACGNTSHIKNRAKAMKNKERICSTACNTRAASKERWLPTCDTVPHGPTRAVSAPVGPERRALRWRTGASRPVSASAGPCGAERLRRNHCS